MTIRTDRNRNTNNIATVPAGIAVGSATSVTIAAVNSARLYIDVNNDDATNGVWIKLQPASDDNDKKGIFLSKKTGTRIYWTMPTDSIYTGELSAISESGTVNIYITEY